MGKVDEIIAEYFSFDQAMYVLPVLQDKPEQFQALLKQLYPGPTTRRERARQIFDVARRIRTSGDT